MAEPGAPRGAGAPGRGGGSSSGRGGGSRAAAGDRRRRWWAPASVRGRLTLAATTALALVLVVAAAGLLVLVRTSLVAALDDAAAASAGEVAALAGARPLPDPLPVTGAAVVQVLDAQGRVVASSPGGDRLTPLVDADEVARVRDGGAVALDGGRLGSAEPFRVVGRPVGAGAGDASGGVVLVATSLADVDRSLDVLRRVTLVAVPLALLVVALLAWRTAGSALAPVESLRRGAQELVASPDVRGERAAALPVPGSRDEVARLARTLNDVLARLHGAGERQRVFVGDAAHELRSPLGSLRAQLEVALARPQDQDWPLVARECLVDVERTGVLVEDLLVLARLDEPGAGRELVDLTATAAEVARATVGRVPVRTVGPEVTDEVASPGSPPRPVVRGDARALRRAVENLVANAVRHAAHEVVVEVRRDGDDVVLDVLDDGPGIPPADRERVFERFTRLDDARDRESGGTGLGLSIVRAAVERDGGTATALEAASGGALLRVRLPAARG